MKKYFVDTNIFMRFLIADQKKQYLLAKKVFQLAEEGKISLWTTDVVILEIIWTLKSFYELSSEEIKNKISSLFAMENVSVKNKDLLLEALNFLVEEKVDFADAYNFLLARKEQTEIISFDKDFDKLGKRVSFKKLIK